MGTPMLKGGNSGELMKFRTLPRVNPVRSALAGELTHEVGMPRNDPARAP